MLKLQKLSLIGFKSFADPIELDFNDGLTGVVGPNGCGKSNVVEGLRWVMGESRAKALRGGELEDVIFAGTSLRPARGLAEVKLTLGNPHRNAPAPYTDQETIEIVRTVTRASGSSYKINGRPARARDVHLFLSEANTGAHSPAFVTQGQVASLISAKPEQRRVMIEEAAGISGLYMRRKEAEQRLNAASGNLTRVQDIMLGLTAQIDTLAKQAEDARRYSGLSERIQVLEAAIAKHEYARLKEGVKNAQEALVKKLAAKNDTEAALAALENGLTEAREAYALVKQEEEAAKAALAAVENERVRLTERQQSRGREEELLTGQIESLDAQDTQLKERIETLTVEAREAEEKLTKRLAETQEQSVMIDFLRTARQETLRALQKTEEEVQDAKSALMTAIAAEDARAVERRSVTERIATVSANIDSVGAELRSATSDMSGFAFAETQSIERDLAALEDLRGKTLARETELNLEAKSTEEQWDALRPQKSAAEKTIAALEAEYNLLQKALQMLPSDTVLSAMRVKKNYDRAVAVVLGETANAGLSDKADLYWAEASSASLPVLPDGLHSLADYVENAPQLNRLLSCVGVANSETQAEKAAAKLQPGQMIVTQDGALWRWDGLRVKAEYRPSAALVLEQRQRADALRKQIAQESAAAEQMRALDQELAETLRDVKAKLAAFAQEKNGWTAREQELLGRRRKLEREAQDYELRLMSLRTKLTGFDEELSRLETRLADLGPEGQSTIDPALEEAVAEALEAKALAAANDEDARAKLGDAEAQARLSDQECAQLARNFERLQSDGELAAKNLMSHQGQKVKTQQRLVDLKDDQQKITEELLRLETLQSDKKSAWEALVEAVAVKADGLRDVEASQSDATKKARAAYEAWIDAGAQTQSLQRQFEELGLDIESRFGVDNAEELELVYPAIEGGKTSWLNERTNLLAEREAMGLINMKAPEEYETAKTQFDTLDKERADLAQAIAELSTTVERINKDARERLTATVDGMNELFGPLFVKMFGGGQANLVWTKAEDILEAGVEIMAQPPGKKLQTLSLLSGGEQALTAIALILAMVKTHPAPLCVFDEIDAALDESNVDRVSQALVDLAADTEARLIVVTHHRLMMARMDRLYGVTMAERGVSKLVSVDLHNEPQLFTEDSDGRLTA